MSASNGPVALVTGTSSGFGLLASVDLAAAGFRVVATMRNLDKRQPLLDAAARSKVELDVVRLDVTDAESIASARRHVEERYGRLDVLVNNAGYGLIGAVEDVSAEVFRAQLETNVIGLAEVTRAFLPMMRAQRSGRVINVSSMGGRTTFPIFAPYHASKFAVEGLTEAMQYELAPFGIHVALIEPGAFGTEFDRGSMVRASSPSSPYRRILENMDSRMSRFRFLAQNPRWVSRTIVRAARARRPRLRYPVGIDAYFMIAMRPLVPWRVRHWLNARAIGVPFRLP
ncbi:MAG: SDR family NAD(P)-dependent oxidoreductase [bacterium]